MSEERRAIVIGGGIGGLCAGIALRRAGLAIVVCEAADAPREVGAGLALWPNALRALDRLGLGGAVRALGTPDWRSGGIYDRRGAPLAIASMRAIAARFGSPPLIVHRAEFQATLADALGRDHLLLGARLLRFAAGDDGAVTAHFADGRAVRGELLVGADGIRSIVRRPLAPDAAPRYAGYTAWRAIVPFDHARVATWGESWGRGARFGVAPVGRDRVYFFATANAPAGGDRRELLVDHQVALLERFGDWHAPIPALLAAAEPTAILRNDIEELPTLRAWGSGPVTLLGDAAHAMTPNLGQGACQAIEDAVALGDSLAGGGDIATALRRYEAARRPRTATIQRLSRRIGVVGQWESPFGCALRDRALRLLTEEGHLRQLDPILDYRVILV